MSQPPLIFIIAGEASGDKLGAELMASLKQNHPVHFTGIGGEAMAAQGLTSLFPMEELSLIGVWSILKNLPSLLGRLSYTVKTIREMKPDAVITIDAPEFNFRVHKRLRQDNDRPRQIHYVAPTVWAWRPWMAKKVAGFLDHLLCLFPFEPPYFEKYGLKTTFVGHPLVRNTGLLRFARNDDREETMLHTKPVIASPAESRAKQSRLLHKRDPKLLCVLPGSRRSEVERLLPIFKETVLLLKKELPHIQVILPTVPAVEPFVREGVKDWPVEVDVVLGDEARHTAFGKASVALAASGTVALQLAAANLPFVIAYKVDTVNEWIARLLFRTPWVCMVNILLVFQKFGPNFVLTPQAKELVPDPWIPEFLQKDCTAEKIAPAVLKLLIDRKAQADQHKALQEAVSLLEAPPELVANTVWEEIL